MKRASTLLTRLAALWAALVLSLTTVLAAEGDILFLDVSGDAWYAEAVQYVRGHGIMNGTTATTFSPDQIMTHAGDRPLSGSGRAPGHGAACIFLF